MIKQYNEAVYEHVNRIHLRLSDFGYAAGGSEWKGGRYPSSASRLYYIISGDPYLMMDEQRIPLEPGKCYLIPSNCCFGWGCETSIEKLFFHITLSDFSGIDLLRRCGQVMECTPDPSTFERLKACVTSRRLTDGMRLRHELEGTLFELFEKYSFEPEMPCYSPEVRRALEFIGAHLSGRLTVSEVADGAFVSISTLAKKFRKELEMTVSDYIENAVMREAEILLVSTNLSVQQISEQLDFCYQSYFTRRFKQWNGQTPQQFRKSEPKTCETKKKVFIRFQTRSGEFDESLKRR